MRGTKSGWAFSARVDGVVVAEGTDSTVLTLYSMQTEINAVTSALSSAKHQLFRNIVFVSNSFSTLEKVREGQLHSDWSTHINYLKFIKITWIFCPGHAGVAGNNTKLAGEAAISINKVLLDMQIIFKMVSADIGDSREK